MFSRGPSRAVKSYGEAENANLQWRRDMEDAHIIVDGFLGDPNTAYLGLFDGHGGAEAANFVRDNLHKNLASCFQSNPHVGVREAFRTAYTKTNEALEKAHMSPQGTTAVTVLLRKEGKHRRLYAANAGDARAVLGGKNGVTRLTYDHKASDEAEAERVRLAGGYVAMGRVSGILAVSRAFGDFVLTPYVTHEPYQSDTTLKDDDQWLIVACDGVWDVLTDHEAIALARSCRDGQAAADLLVKTALEKESKDNISCIVAKL